MNVGIVGTGAMGKPMARNIIKSDHILFVYARHPEKVASLKKEGAKVVHSPADVGKESNIVILSLPFDQDVEEVLRGEKGILATIAPGSIVVDTTTGTPAAAEKMAERCSQKGVGYLDAPISGGVKRAEEATLTFIIGGDESHVEKAAPVINKLGSSIFIVGPVGAGRILKMLNQMIAGMNTLVLCETVALGQRFGIAPKTFFEVLSTCAANSFHMQSKMPKFIIPEDFDGGHRIVMMIKDLEIALGEAKSKKFPLLLAGLGTELYKAGAGSGYAEKDISSMVKFFGSFNRK